jgi:hypothetical protein
MRGPGFANVDAGIVREFPLRAIREALRAQFRFEAFNLFNRTNFANPNTGITNSNFGRLLSTDGEPRILQFAVRFQF